MVEQTLRAGDNVIAESNRLVAWCRADLVLFVVAPEISDWKRSSEVCLSAADAVIISGDAELSEQQSKLLEHTVPALPRFRLDSNPQPVFASWLERRLGPLPSMRVGGH